MRKLAEQRAAAIKRDAERYGSEAAWCSCGRYEPGSVKPCWACDRMTCPVCVDMPSLLFKRLTLCRECAAKRNDTYGWPWLRIALVAVVAGLVLVAWRVFQ